MQEYKHRQTVPEMCFNCDCAGLCVRESARFAGMDLHREIFMFVTRTDIILCVRTCQLLCSVPVGLIIVFVLSSSRTQYSVILGSCRTQCALDYV